MHTGGLHKGNDAKLFKAVVDNFKDVVFVQVGGEKSDVAKYKKYYQSYSNILFIERQDRENIVKYQMSADILFYALTRQNKLWKFTSPLKVFEYMATGVPILGSSIGSVKEVLNNQNSIPFSPEDESSIIDGVNFFLRDKSRAEQVSHKALMEVRGQYSWEARVKNIIHFLR
jgi:glycosyltransferase involved in cell wall biosynthesis